MMGKNTEANPVTRESCMNTMLNPWLNEAIDAVTLRSISNTIKRVSKATSNPKKMLEKITYVNEFFTYAVRNFEEEDNDTLVEELDIVVEIIIRVYQVFFKLMKEGQDGKDACLRFNGIVYDFLKRLDSQESSSHLKKLYEFYTNFIAQNPATWFNVLCITTPAYLVASVLDGSSREDKFLANTNMFRFPLLPSVEDESTDLSQSQESPAAVTGARFNGSNSMESTPQNSELVENESQSSNESAPKIPDIDSQSSNANESAPETPDVEANDSQSSNESTLDTSAFNATVIDKTKISPKKNSQEANTLGIHRRQYGRSLIFGPKTDSDEDVDGNESSDSNASDVFQTSGKASSQSRVVPRRTMFGTATNSPPNPRKEDTLNLKAHAAIQNLASKSIVYSKPPLPPNVRALKPASRALKPSNSVAHAPAPVSKQPMPSKLVKFRPLADKVRLDSKVISGSDSEEKKAAAAETSVKQPTVETTHKQPITNDSGTKGSVKPTRQDAYFAKLMAKIAVKPKPKLIPDTYTSEEEDGSEVKLPVKRRLRFPKTAAAAARRQKARYDSDQD